MQNQAQKKQYSVTVDKNVDLQKLMKLERKGIIRIYQVEVESTTKKIKDVDFPVAVLDYTRLNGSLVGSKIDERKFELIKRIIGGNNVGDTIHLYTHIRKKRYYFITEDKDILDKKSILEKKFKGLKIKTANELIGELDK